MLFKRCSKEKDVLQKANEVLEFAKNALMKADALYTQTEYERSLLIDVLKKFADKTETPNVETEPDGWLNEDVPSKPLTLKALREEKGLSLREMANKIGCSKSAISCWEQGTVKPPFAKIVSIASLFGCTISEIEDAIQKTADEKFLNKNLVSVTISPNALDLRGLRKKYGYYQSDIAKKLRISANTVSAWETGVNRITSHSISVLATLYGISVEEVEVAAKKSYKGEY